MECSAHTANIAAVLAAVVHEFVVRTLLHDDAVVEHDDPVGAHRRGSRCATRIAVRPSSERSSAASTWRSDAGPGSRSPRRAPAPVAGPGTCGRARSAAVRRRTATPALVYRGASSPSGNRRPTAEADHAPHRLAISSSVASGGRRRCCPGWCRRTGTTLAAPHRAGAQRGMRDVAQIVPVDQHLPGGRVVEARDQLRDRRLARAGRTDEGDGLARRRSQVDVVQDRRRGVVSERDVLETICPRPVGDRTAATRAPAAVVEEVAELRRAPPCPLVSGVELRELLDRLEERVEVEHERGQLADVRLPSRTMCRRR